MRNVYEITLALLLLMFFGFVAFYPGNTGITGHILYETSEKTANWTFDDENDFSYDTSLAEISGGAAKMVSTTAYTYWNTSTEEYYSVIFALYDPSDKTDKVNSMDNKKHEAKEGKLFEMLFSSELGNGDMVSLYIKDGGETDVYLCGAGVVCSTPDYGSVSYEGEEGWHNITISGLQSPTKIISIAAQGEEVEFDYITSTKGDIAKALYGPSDKTSKIQSKDDDELEVNKNKMFNIVFDSKLNNGDIISFYIADGNQGDVYLCDYGDDCSAPGYGLANFNGNEGWLNLTIARLSSPNDIFNLNTDKDMKLDYIKAIHADITEHSSTNISYPHSASIETKDISIAGLSSFLDFDKNELLNGQSISYYYSLDSGSSWNAIPQNNNLSDVSASSGKIRIKADLAGSGAETPSIYDFAVSYSTKICNENWNLTYGECLSSNTRLKYYVDKNDCGTMNNLQLGNGTYESCVYVSPCNEDWNATYGICLSNNTKLKYYTDKNECGTITNLPADNGTYETCDYAALCNENWNLTYGACLPNDTMLKYYADKNDCGTTNSLPADNGTYTTCDYCSPDWSCAAYGECWLDNVRKCTAAEDNNSCYKLTNLSSDAYSGNYTEFDLSCVYNKTGAGFSNVSISTIANEKLVIDGANSTDAVIELNASISIENSFISITNYSNNRKNISPSLTALNKYLDIEANNSLKNSINSVKIRVYYTDEEINDNGIDEDSLKIHYFNETSNQWEELNSTVNLTGNYVEATIGHLSTFGVFGNRGQSSSGGGSGGSGGGGGGGRTRITSPSTATKTADTALSNNEDIPAGGIAIKEEKIESGKSQTGDSCDYRASAYLPEHISFVESDRVAGIVYNAGNCMIESLNINFESSSLASILGIEPKFIRNLDVNQSAEIFLTKMIEPEANPLIQGLGIKLPADIVSTYNGSVIVGAVIEDKIAFEEKINVTIDVLETPLISKIMGSKAAFLILVLAILAAFLLFAYAMRKKRKANPPADI